MIDKHVKLLFIVSVILLLNSCNLFFESEFDKEQKTINEYHKQVLIKKGKKFYYIPKDKVLKFFPSLDTIDRCYSKKNYTVLFFDYVGNIVYQSKIHSVDKKCNIKISCLNLGTGEYYLTKLSKESIIGFKGYEFSHFIITSAN